MKLKELERWLTASEAAAIVGISRQALYPYLYDGRLRAVETRAGWLIDPEDADRLRQERGDKNG